MKKLIFTLALIMGSLSLFAQVLADSSRQPAKSPQPVLKNNEGSKMLPGNDATTNIYNSPEFWQFYRAIKYANLSETIRSRGPLTVFAPDNDAFAKLPPGKLDSLLFNVKRQPDLIAMVTYHVIPGVLKAKDIIHEINVNHGTATFITLTGNKLTAKLDANRNIVLIDENGGQSVISKFDIPQNNGIIHIINAVLIPRSKEI